MAAHFHDDFAHHSHDDLAVAHHGHDHATAFIHLNQGTKHALYNMFVGPEVSAYNWAHAKIAGLWGAMAGPVVPPEQQGHMVEYFAKGCPHCTHLDPVWKEAAGMWDKEGGEHAKHVVWEQKECLDENWKPGADYKDCQAQHISRFPTIKFHAPGSSTGEDFFLERSPAGLVDFAKTGIAPNPDVMPRLPGDVSDMKLVDFYAASCPHCKTLDPVWEDAHKQWDKTIGQSEDAPREDLPLISFEKKECYDNHWKPGKDAAFCEKFHVESFPTIKLFKPDEHGHGFSAVDYHGPRTREGIVDFLKESTGYVEEPLQLTPVVPAADAHAAAGAAHHELVPAGIKVPDAVRILSEGANAPDSVKAVPEDLTALQGNTPQVAAEAAAAMTIDKAVATAMMPLPMLACLPVRAKAKMQRVVVHSPPIAKAQFI